MKKQHSLFNITTKESSMSKHENMKTEKIKNKTINKINSNSSISANNEWHSTKNKLPNEFMPIEFNTEYTDIVTGYRIKNDYITDTPYYLNKFKKLNGYIEWRYISSCRNLESCPHEFPQCNYCNKNK